MAEYIEREAAIAYIREQSEECQKAFEELGGESGIYADAYNDLAEDFYRIPTADVAPEGWISVKDRLPEPEQEVLVIAHGWSSRLLYIGSYQRVKAETSRLTGVTSKASDWSLWGWSYLREPEVTHWMPLPEPPMSARMDGESNGKAD